MSARLSESSTDSDEIERLLDERELLDATELIAQIGHCQWDYNHNRLISCSRGYARIFNMSVEEVIAAQSNWEISLAQIHPEDRDLYLEAYYAQQESGNYTVDYRMLRNDGALRWLRETGLLKFDPDGAVVDAFGIVQDITEQMVRAQDLEDQQQLARQVEAITDIGYFINDEVNDINLYISPGYARIHGRSVDEFNCFTRQTGDNLAAVHEDDREILRAKIIEYCEQGRDTFDTEYRVVKPDGQVIWVRERSKARRKVNGKVTETLGVLQDITDKKTYEQNLKQSKDLLEETVAERTEELAETVRQLQQEIVEREVVSSELESKNAELERFTYTVSHDLKTPLVTIKGFLGLLNKDLEADDRDKVAVDMDKINQAADTMGRLLEELLELSRIGRVVGELVLCDLTDIAQHSIMLVDARIKEKQVEVRVDELPPVYGDRVRLTEVFQNLLENAIKFMGDQPAPRIHIGVKREQGRNVYFVRDNGVGIAEVYHDLVFGLFERLGTEVEGSGVGLTLVKRIVELHNGEVWVESDGPGQGTTVSFTLPTDSPV